VRSSILIEISCGTIAPKSASFRTLQPKMTRLHW
jgi:hypothetical protein